ncbi:MAG TPA: riboflavin synthase [Usitatibacter sp.]|nr:riboflavin synthase [Usitatibacter sp.]
MFSGIVTAVGAVADARPHGDGRRLSIHAPGLGMDDVRVGDSIAVQGVCLTVVQRDDKGFEADVSAATLSVTHGLEKGRAVNLEKSLQVSDRLGGHIVAGHVDGVGTVRAFEDLGGSRRLEVEVPAALSRYVARKASVTVDGVSLTTNEVRGATFEVNLIPHTLAVTTLGKLAVGDRVNIEVDLLARYVERLMGRD